MLKAKDKEKILKAARAKWYITYKGTPERLTADFPAEAVEARGGGIILKVLKEKNKKPLNQESYIQQSYLSKTKAE